MEGVRVEDGSCGWWKDGGNCWRGGDRRARLQGGRRRGEVAVRSGEGASGRNSRRGRTATAGGRGRTPRRDLGEEGEGLHAALGGVGEVGDAVQVKDAEEEGVAGEGSVLCQAAKGRKRGSAMCGARRGSIRGYRGAGDGPGEVVCDLEGRWLFPAGVRGSGRAGCRGRDERTNE